jgi:hypothetical protein
MRAGKHEGHEGHEGAHEAEQELAPPRPEQFRTDVAVAVDAQKVLSRTRALNRGWKALWIELGGVT